MNIREGREMMMIERMNGWGLIEKIQRMTRKKLEVRTDIVA